MMRRCLTARTGYYRPPRSVGGCPDLLRHQMHTRFRKRTFQTLALASRTLSHPNWILGQSSIQGAPHNTCFHTVVGKKSFQTWTQMTKREMAELEERLWQRVGLVVQDPTVGQNLATLQWLHRRVAVSEDGTLQMLLKLPSLLHPSLFELKESIRKTAETEVQEWLRESGQQETLSAKVNVEAIATKPVSMMARLVDDPKELLESIGPGLSNVSHFLAVYSCKGGVGKSTVAVNLAYEMARMGGRVGLLDLDIYGPSLPLLVRPEDVTVRRSPVGSMIYPLVHGGVKLLSLGFVSTNSGVPGSGQDNGAAVMRGPMAGSVVSQLLKGTDWGELDILILDLPPGTGDVQLQVLQDLQLSGAVAVTTPSTLAAVDTRKGIEMFTSLGVPTLAVVENMSYFQCEGGGKHFPFGRGQFDLSHNNDKAQRVHATASVVQLPISTITNAANDSAEPLCLCRPDGATQELRAFQMLAENVAGELLRMQFGRNVSEEFVTFGGSASEVFDVATTRLSLDKSRGETFVVRLHGESGAIQKRVSSAELRSRDPKSGDVIENSPFRIQLQDEAATVADPVVTTHKASEKKSPSLTPNKVGLRGHYGFAVQWADGATIIYSKKCVAVAAGGTVNK